MPNAENPVTQPHSDAQQGSEASTVTAQSATTRNIQPWYRRIRWWGWTLIAIAVLFVGFFGTFGAQAYMVYRHEMAAIHTVVDTARSGSMQELPNAVRQMQEETRKANAITHNGLWQFTGKIRGLRSNIRAAQELTQIVEDASVEVVPDYVDIASHLRVEIVG